MPASLRLFARSADMCPIQAHLPGDLYQALDVLTVGEGAQLQRFLESDQRRHLGPPSETRARLGRRSDDSTLGSAPLPLGLALFAEGPHAFLEVLGREGRE